MIILQNQFLKATIAEKGAELQSLKRLDTDLEYMWGGDPAVWGKHSPVLFPIVGSLKEDTYFYNDKAYKLPRHGFARDNVFQAKQISETEAVFTLTQSESTLAVYPFEFKLSLRYTIIDSALTCTYEVYNPASSPLLFSVGGHPAFAVPVTKTAAYTDHYLDFNTTTALHRWKLIDGLISDHADALPTDEGRLNLSPGLFYEDAIVLKNIGTTTISLRNTKDAHGLNFNFEGFPFFGIWAAKDASFVCLEPWCGIADSVDHDQQLINKEGIISIAAKEHWQRHWSVECF